MLTDDARQELHDAIVEEAYKEAVLNAEPEDPALTDNELIAETRLNRDLREAALGLDVHQARYLVDLYYSLQKLRIGAASQVRAAKNEPNKLIAWTFTMYEQLEKDVKAALQKYAESQVPGQWALSQLGIGPVIAAGLLAHIDPERTTTAGKLWRFAGYDPTIVWLGQAKSQSLVDKLVPEGMVEVSDEVLLEVATQLKRPINNLYPLARNDAGVVTRSSLAAALARRPWNARLKRLCWLIGQSFVKSSGREKSFYGPYWRERKLLLMERNDRFEFAETAAQILREKRIGKDTDAYAAYSRGQLPKAHIEARAEREAVKLFLSHWWEVMYEDYYKKPAPEPYVIAHKGHTDYIPPPNWPMATEEPKKRGRKPVSQPV